MSFYGGLTPSVAVTDLEEDLITLDVTHDSIVLIVVFFGGINIF